MHRIDCSVTQKGRSPLIFAEGTAAFAPYLDQFSFSSSFFLPGKCFTFSASFTAQMVPPVTQAMTPRTIPVCCTSLTIHSTTPDPHTSAFPLLYALPPYWFHGRLSDRIPRDSFVCSSQAHIPGLQEKTLNAVHTNGYSITLSLGPTKGPNEQPEHFGGDYITN